jgi:signal transduction histidine kinase/ActR/RegA family two-component response regulator
LKRRNIRLRTVLAVLVLATTLPLGLFAGLLIVMSWQQQRAIVDRQNVETARAVMTAVDKEIQGTMHALSVLSAVDELQHHDLSAFNRLASYLVTRQPGWQSVVLIDADGRVVIDTAAGGVARRPALAAAWVQAATVSEHGMVSDLISDPSAGFLVLVCVPVLKDGKLQFVLGARLRSSSISGILRAQKLPAEGVVTLIDRSARIIARTRGEQQYAGKLPSETFRDAAARMSEGSWRGAMLEGTPSYSALSRSPLSGWTVGVGMPAEEIDGPIRRSMWALAGVGVGILALGVAFAFLFGHFVVRALGSAAAAVAALARSEPMPEHLTQIAEIEELGHGLRDAAAILSKRLYERDQAEAERRQADVEREQALRAEQAARREAEAANRSKDEFVATISHELRTPLNAILGWVKLLRTGRLDPTRQTRALEVIERNTRAQSQLIEDLLDMSRVVAGNVRLDRRVAELGPIVNSAAEAIRPAAEAKSIELVLPPSEPSTLVLCDPDRMQQVVWNLLVNSIKFTPEGGRIEVSMTVEGPEVSLSVSDTGVGIDPQFLAHVFERFRQGSSSYTRRYGGLGIGLALVRHLVKLHGGTVSAYSEGTDRGARFTVRLPVMAAGESSNLPQAPAQISSPELDGLRVLVVDDDQDTRELLVAALSHAEARVSAAESVSEALDLLNAEAFDVLISDIAMPERSGYDLLREIRANPRTDLLPAIALTAFSRAEDRERALRAGFNFHIGKPFEITALLHAIAIAAGRERHNAKST